MAPESRKADVKKLERSKMSLRLEVMDLPVSQSLDPARRLNQCRNVAAMVLTLYALNFSMMGSGKLSVGAGR